MTLVSRIGTDLTPVRAAFTLLLMEAWDEPAADIRAAGLRCTAQRVAVLGALRTERAHLRVDDVAERVRERIGTISHQAVYDALGALVGAGLARRIEPAGSPALYEARAGDNHHHLVCRHCGTTVDVDCVQGEAPCLEPTSTHGFAVDEAEVTFWGVCPDCQPGAGHSPSR